MVEKPSSLIQRAVLCRAFLFGATLSVLLPLGVSAQTRLVSLEIENAGANEQDTRVLNAVSRAFEQSGRARMVERRQLDRVIKERILGETLGTVEAPEITVAAYKGFVSYEYKVAESDGELLEQYGITVRLVDLGGNVAHLLTTAGMFSAMLRKVKLKDLNTLEAAVKRLEITIRRKLPAQGMVVQSSENDLVIDLGKGDGLRKRSTVTVVEFDRIIHPDDGSIVLHKRPIGILECFNINQSSSSCRITSKEKEIGRGAVVELGAL